MDYLKNKNIIEPILKLRLNQPLPVAGELRYAKKNSIVPAHNLNYYAIILTFFIVWTVNAQMLPKKFTDLIVSGDKSVDEKLKLIETFKSEGMILDSTNAYRIIKYIPKTDKKLATSLLDFIVSMSYQGTQIETSVAEECLIPLMERYLKDYDYASFRFVLSVLEILYDKDTSLKEKNFFIYSNLFLFRFLKKGDSKLLNFYLTRYPSELPEVGLFISPTGKEICEYYLNHIDPENVELTCKLLNYILKSEVIFLIENRHLKLLVDLTSMDSLELKNLSSTILAKVTHQKEIQNWNEWWNINSLSFDIVKSAIASLINNKENKESRLFAARQLGYIFLFSNNNPEIIKVFESVICDSTIPSDIRIISFKNLVFILVNIESFAHFDLDNSRYIFDSTLKCTRSFILKEAQAHDVLCLLPKEIINTKDVHTEILKILNEKQMNRRSRGSAAYALGFSTYNKKNIGKSILNFLKEDLPGREADTADNRAVSGLMSLTKNEKFHFNLEEWDKIVSKMPDDPPQELENTKEK